MTRDEIRARLEAGDTFEARITDDLGATLAEGRVKWTGTEWSGRVEGRAVALVIEHDGGAYRAPLVKPVSVKPGETLSIEFGGKWRNG